MTLYGKSAITELICSMIRRGRLPHAFMIIGESGVGKKTLCRHIAKQILCEKGTGVPCGECLACKKTEKGIHPDFIEKTPGGKNGNYLSDELRSIVSDAQIAPNESEKKIYFLPDIDRSLPEAQNMLLKVLEEPPPHVMFLMTACSREKILPTVMSRVIAPGLCEMTEEECRSALKEKFGENGREELIERAISVYGGNVGKCIQYVENEGQSAVLTALNGLLKAMSERDEFMMAAALSSLDLPNGRGDILELLASFKTVLRDVAAQKLDAPLCSENRAAAAKLSKNIRRAAVDRMYQAVSVAEKRINGNAAVGLCLSDLCGRLAKEL